MPIDSRIALMGRGVELNDPLDVTAKAITLHSMMQQDQAQGAYAINPQTGEVDVASTRKNLAKISPKLAMQFDRDQNMHQAAMLKASRDNETQQRLGEKARLDAAKERAKMYQGVVKNSLLTYYDALHQGGDENAARQAGDQAYKAGLGQLHEQGAIGPKAMQQQVSFDPDKFQQTMGMSEDQWTQTAAKIGDMDAEGGYSDGPGADAGGGMMPAAMVQGQPAQGGMPAPQQAPQGEFVQTAAAKAPAFTEQDVQAMPDVSPGAGSPGKGYNWQKAYQFTQLKNPKVNPMSAPVILDYRTGQPIQNEPLMASRERVAKAGKAQINAAGGNIDLGVKGSNDIDTQLVQNSARMSRLKSIMDTYEPEFQTIGGKLTGSMSALKEQFLGGKLDPGSKAQLERISTFRRRAYDDFNQTLKVLSGTAVSAQEFERVKRGMPNPGEGLFDGDSPTEFISKLRDSYASLRMAQARLMYFKKNGIPATDEGWNKVPLDSMPGIMRKRADELTAEVKKKNPAATKEDINRTIKPQLAEEFGLQ